MLHPDADDRHVSHGRARAAQSLRFACAEWLPNTCEGRDDETTCQRNLVRHGDARNGDRRVTPDEPDVAQATAATIAGVANRLRQQRTARGLTLAEVAAQSDISISTLSRLESGKRRPTLELLLALANTYQLPLDDLVGAPEVGDPRVHLRPVHKRDRIVVPLTRRTEGLLAFKVLLSPSTEADPPARTVTHHGMDWLYVLSGTLRLRLGDQDHIIQAGEAAEFDCTIPHGFAAENGEPVEFINLLNAEGHSVHQREL